jgi:NAD(P)H dehydrogenase (quinone)
MASSSLNDPADMSPADLGTAKAYGERFAKYVETGNTPLTPYRDFTA